MTAHERNQLLAFRIAQKTGRCISAEDAGTLRRAALTLHRWAEAECGTSNDYASVCLMRDDDGKTYQEVYPHAATRAMRYRVPDRETGALRRVAALCRDLGLHYYHQGDPRGCALYVSSEPLTDATYTRGLAIA